MDVMVKFQGDGTDKKPRQVQADYFNHLEQNWQQYHVLDGPPGIGKSFIARAIQLAVPNTGIITPNNVLVKQYSEAYNLNALMGKDNYDNELEYHAAKSAVKGVETVFNPLSFYYYYLRNEKVKKPTTVVIDEAHKLADMLLLTLSKDFPVSYYNIPKGLSEGGFLQWLDGIVHKMAPITRIVNPSKGQAKLINQFENLFILYDYLSQHLDKVKISYEVAPDWRGKDRLVLRTQPLTIPHELLHTIFGEKTRFIMMSGTITQFDIDELLPGQDVDYYRIGALAPVENRYVIHKPLTSRRNIEQQVNAIADLYTKHGKVNTLVHVTYSDMPLIAKGLQKRGVSPLHHNKEDKEEVLNKFKEKGGLLLAAGMAEGVDLPGDMCRLLIIPRLQFPYLGDSGVKKRMALPNGQEWYDLHTMKTTVQQLGRGVRGGDDACISYILDPLFPKLIEKTKKYLHPTFREALKSDKS
jgi:hypothetical protein